MAGPAKVPPRGLPPVHAAASALRDENGNVNPYARKVHERLEADLLYLTSFAMMGHQEAAEMVCEEYGHDGRGGVCERCGRGYGPTSMGVG